MKYRKGTPSKEGGYLRTGSRTPMQWDKSLNAGFSSAPEQELYLQLDPNENRPCVEEQMMDETSIYNSVKNLLELRKKYSCLGNTADFEFVELSNERYPLAYIRNDGKEKFLIVINPSNKSIECKKTEIGEVIFKIGEDHKDESDKMIVAPCSAFIARLK